jgi:hypothetical protein
MSFMQKRPRAIFITRELLKLAVIVVCLVFAIILLMAHGSPIGFVPLLPWALR